MPPHDFLRRACEKEFSKILTPWECEKGSTVRSKSKKVERRWAAF
jgi:hypothetical protein